MVGTAVVGAGAFMAKFAADGVAAARDMEEQMSNIAAVMGKAKEEIEPLNDLIIDLGLNPNLKVTAVEAAEAIEMLAKNGLSMNEILEGAAEATVLLANSTGGTFAQSANIATDVMAVFGIEAENVMDAVNGITAVTTNSKFTIDDYALALAQGGGVASAVGVGFEDFNATIAAISPLFASGSDAGTSMKTMLQRMIPASNKAEDAMKELGLISEEGANQFFDANGNMKDMAEIAGILQGSLGDLSEQEKTQALSTIFGADAMRAAVGLAETGEEAFRDLADEMGETDALDSAATRMDNLAGATEVLEGIIETVQLQVGQAFVPVIRELVDWLASLADRHGPAVIAVFEDISAFVVGFTQEIANGLDPLAAFVEALLNWTNIGENMPFEMVQFVIDLEQKMRDLWARFIEIVTPIVEAIASFVEWQDILIALGIVLASVILPVIGSLLVTLISIAAPLVALIGLIALVREAWVNDWGGIRTALVEFWENQGKPILEQLQLWLAENIPLAIETLKTFWETVLLPAIQLVWQWMQETLIPFIQDVLVPWLQEKIPEALQALADFWENTLLPAIETFFDFLKDDLLPLFQELGLFLIELGDVALTALAGIWENVLLPALKSIWKFISEKVIPIFEAVGKKIGSVNESVGGLSGVIQRVIGWLKKLRNQLENIELPDWMTPGSPTPWEIGLRGVADAMRELNGIELRPLVDAGALAPVTGGGFSPSVSFGDINAQGAQVGVAEDIGAAVDRAVDRAMALMGRQADQRGRMG